MSRGQARRRTSTWAALCAVLAGVVAGCAPAHRAAGFPAPAAISEQVADAVRAGLGRMPVSFIANQGRWDPRAAWVVPGAEATAYFLDGGVRWAMTGQDGSWALDQVLVGARSAPPTASVPAAGVVSYFGAESHAGMSTANELKLSEAWPGVDVTWSGTGGNIEATYRLGPGADPDQVRVAWRGAESVAVTGDGRLAVTTPVRTFEEDAPKAFQDIDGQRVEVEVAYELDGPDAYGFRLGPYDRGQPLVIDPTVLVYAGFLGGSEDDIGNSIAVDGAGNAYVTGETASLAATFPESPGGFQVENAGNTDAFVVKVNPAGSTLVYAAFLGGSAPDRGKGIAVDGAGNAYVTGETNSLAATFPETAEVFGAENAGAQDAFVAKVNPAGSALVYAGFLGGSSNDRGQSIAVDGSGNAYITGGTESLAGTFPETPAAFQAQNAGALDAFVAQVNPAGSALVYAGFLGGSGNDTGYGIAVDSAGNAYVTGETTSLAASFPDTPDMFQAANAGGFDAFVAKVNPAGSALVYAGFLGGSAFDRGEAIAVDSAGNAYITGQTVSPAASFPQTSEVFQAENAGSADAFVAKVDPSGSALVYAGFLGGSGSDAGLDIALDGLGNAYVVGSTTSQATTFPETAGFLQSQNAGNTDAFVAKVNPTGSALVDAGFLGGSGNDAGYGIAVDSAGNAYITGETRSLAATFPETPAAFGTANSGSRDAFVALIAEPAQLSIGDTSVTEGDSGTATATFTITRSGNTAIGSAVDWSTLDGSAVAPTDYTAVSATTVNFAGGETTKTVSVTVNGDTTTEPNDGFTVNLASPVGATIDDGTAVGRITNDDFASFSVDDVTVIEGDAGPTLATFTITRTGAAGGEATVDWRTLNAHASAGSDYVAVPITTVAFSGGSSSVMVSVTVNGDTDIEPTESFYVRLSNPTAGHTIADATGVGTITTDDSYGPNTFNISDATLTEGDSGTSLATFTVARAGDTSKAASVQWFTVAGTATAGADFAAVSPTTLNFADNETSRVVSVTVNGDAVIEANETFAVRLGSPIGATISDGSGLGRITNDDVASFAVDDVTLTEGNAGTTTFTFTVSRTGTGIGGTATVQWTTSDGTATSASGDYVAVPLTTLTFGPGDTTKSAAVTVNGDTAPEANETFRVVLSSPVGAGLADGSGLGRITNDD